VEITQASRHLSINATNYHKAAAYVLLFEFVAHQAVYVLGVQISDLLQYERLYLAYSLIQLLTLFLMSKIQSHFVIKSLILLNLGYNVLTISQYVYNSIDFYSFYSYFVGLIMILEICYLVGLTKYAANYRRKHGNTSFVGSLHLFFTGNRIRVRGVL